MKGWRAGLLASVSLLAINQAYAYNDPQTGVQVTDLINKNYVVSTSATNTTTTTGAVITGLSLSLTAGKTYVCEADIRDTSPNTTAGADVGLVATSSLSATSIAYTVHSFAAATVAITNASSLATYSSNAQTIIDNWISGAIVVNVAGTINVYGHQHTQYTTTATSFLENSWLECTRIN